jgi:iodotyrosine deiodinase
METHPFIPLQTLPVDPAQSMERAEGYYELMDRRRSVRHFSDRPVARALVERLLLTASTAPSGAHKQPWTFCAVSDPSVKAAIRRGAEREEYEGYHGRMGAAWLNDLAPFGTTWEKPFLETAPWLVVVFKRLWETQDDTRRKCYYVNESVGIATGILISAIHQAGLVTLTHTPSPMQFLQEILGRPDNERPFLLLPVGYPAEGAQVPRLQRKPLDQVAVFYESPEGRRDDRDH